MALEDLRAVGFIDPGPEHETLLRQFDRPTATATITLGNTQRTVRLFRSNPTSEEAYVVRSTTEPIYLIDPAFLHNLPKEDFKLRDKRLFGMDVKDIAILTVKRGKDRIVLIQQHDEWVLEKHAEILLDRQTVNLFVSRVVDLPAEIRIRKDEQQLTTYGLASPTVEITGMDYQGQSRGRLHLGNVGKGLVYARGAGNQGIYQARSNILNQIPTAEELLEQATN